MDLDKLKEHVKLCRKNLKSKRVKCCAGCPFQEEITSVYPDLKYLFERKQEQLSLLFKKHED